MEFALKIHLRFLDILFLLLSFGVTLYSASLVWWSTQSGGPPLVEIQSTGGTYLYPLSEDRDVKVDGPAGMTLIRIKSGEAYAVSSPGPLKIIMQMGRIRKPGEWLASLPNSVFVRIRGDAKNDVDASMF